MPRHDHSPMFGRVEELALLKSLLEGARDGRSGVRVVHGDPGIGKTALLCQLESEAPGFQVLRGLGIESETELPFAGLHRLCTMPLI